MKSFRGRWQRTLLQTVHTVAIMPLACLSWACAGQNDELRVKLEDAVQRRASVTERILEWGAPSGKRPLKDGRFLYTWEIPWAWNSIDPLCTVEITASSENTIEGYAYHDC